MLKNIRKLIDFGVKKVKIAENIGISRQLLDYRLENDGDFTQQERFNFNKVYGQLVKKIK